MDWGSVHTTASRIARVRGSRANLSPDDQADLAQQVLEQFLRTFGDGDAPENVDAWLETATRNALLNRIRDAVKRPALQFGNGDDEPVAVIVGALRGGSASVLPAVHDLERRVLALVSGEDRQLFDLVLEGRSDAEIASDLGVLPATAKKRRQRMIAKLRVELEADPGLLAELRSAHPHVYPDEQRRAGRPY
jgi:RNA polymerase sigma factor (sigma-70 family)